jgi:hypothetical protein
MPWQRSFAVSPLQGTTVRSSSSEGEYQPLSELVTPLYDLETESRPRTIVTPRAPCPPHDRRGADLGDVPDRDDRGLVADDGDPRR